MGYKHLVLLAGLLVVSLPAWAEDLPMASHQHNPSTNQVEHVEITLPKRLLPGLPVVDESLTMEEAVNLGVANNLGIRVSEAEVDIRRALLKGAQAKRWPVLSLGSQTFLRAGQSQVLMTPDMMMNTVDTALFQDFNASGRVPLFTGGRITAGIRAARFNLEGSQASLRRTIVDTAYQIRQNYLTALLSQQEHVVHQGHLQVQQVLLKNTQARYLVGRGLRADVLRIKTEIADASRMLNEEHVKLNNALFALRSALGVDLSSEFQLSENLTFQPWTGAQLDALVKRSTEQHPRVVEAQKQIQEAKAQLAVARSQYLPQVYGQVTGNLRLPDRPPLMGNGMIAMFSASLPVFDKNRSAEIARAEATLIRAQQAQKAAQLEVATQVAQAWSELQFAKENVALAEAAVNQAQEDLRLIQRRFEVGRAIVVEVQDAAYQLRQAELNRATAIYNHELAKAKLIQSSGEVYGKP